jgi:beta-glucanase (GH16 family)
MTIKTNWLRRNALRLAAATATLIFGGLLACGGGGGGGGASVQPSPEPITTPADTTDPVITVIGSLNQTVEQGSIYTDSGARAIDEVDGSITVDASEIVTDEVGVFFVTYTATDRSGNSATATRTVTVIAASPTTPTTPTTPVGPRAIDSEKWFHQTRLPDGNSWYNGEIQHYTDRIENAYVSDGTLKIAAIRESFTDQNRTKQFTSARLNSKYAFTYGRVDVRAKLPQGVGTWPAIWTLGQNIAENGGYWETQGFGTVGWPACGEIDIMEHWGRDQNMVSSALHTPSSFGGTFNKGQQYIDTASTEFHVYSLDWNADRMIFSVDGVEHYTYAPNDKNSDTWPFDAPQYLLLNFAIEPTIANSFNEDEMEIDYVRVYAPNASASANPVWADEFNN